MARSDIGQGAKRYQDLLACDFCLVGLGCLVYKGFKAIILGQVRKAPDCGFDQLLSFHNSNEGPVMMDSGDISGTELLVLVMMMENSLKVIPDAPRPQLHR
jgi:hypothetical protein